jgi:hypothetical protein
MITVCMDKIVTLMKDLSGGKCMVQELKYKDLPAAIATANEITVNYIFGQEKKRIKQLTDLGYKLKETIFYNNDAPYAKIKQVWAK